LAHVANRAGDTCPLARCHLFALFASLHLLHGHQIATETEAMC
jgi:hypothetical protein